MIRTLNHSFRIEYQPPPAHTPMCAPQPTRVVGCLGKCKSSILSGLPQAKPSIVLCALNRFVGSHTIRLSDYCCQAPDRLVDPTTVDADSLTIARRGRNVLLFSPLGNAPSKPKLALVGITPGAQFTVFARLLRTCPVELAAKTAAFASHQKDIKQLLNAHGFANRLGIDLSVNLNDDPLVLTTSLVKCCLMVDGDNRYQAPDIVGSEEAIFCVRNRFVTDIARYQTLTWVVIFGAPGWVAVNSLTVGSRTVRQHLEAQDIEVLNFPHFSQNFQQREIFQLDPEQEADYFQKHPNRRGYAPEARRMRNELLSAMQRRSAT